MLTVVRWSHGSPLEGTGLWKPIEGRWVMETHWRRFVEAHWREADNGNPLEGVGYGDPLERGKLQRPIGGS